MKLFIPNLNFEDELSARSSKINPQTQAAIDDLAPLMGLLVDAGDAVLVNLNAVPDDLPSCLQHVRFATAEQIVSEQKSVAKIGDLEIVPWGWTSRILQTAQTLNTAVNNAPELHVVKQINSRAFSATFDAVQCSDESSLPFGNERFGRLCLTMEECTNAIRKMVAARYSRWVAKPQLSNAGSNRLLVTGCELNDQQQGWLAKQISMGGVYLEPWIQPISECGLQYVIHPITTGNGEVSASNSSIEFIGATRLINDDVGRYAGSMIGLGAESETQWASSIEYGMQVCLAAQAAGYFGPLGIDSFQFQNASGELGVRLCNDVNARFTMGRLAVALRQNLQENYSGLWCQLPVAQQLNRLKTNNSDSIQELISAMQNVLTAQGENDVFIERTSPLSISGRPVRTMTLLISGPNPQQLLTCHTTLQQFVKRASPGIK